MAIRVSFEIDRDVRDAVEKYARENGLDISSSMQDLLIKGIATVYSGKKYDTELLKNQANEEYRQILENTGELHVQVVQLAEEVRLMQHLLETGWKPNDAFVVEKRETWDQVAHHIKGAIIAVAKPFMPKAPDTKQGAANHSVRKKNR
jgi:hypothetical protein